MGAAPLRYLSASDVRAAMPSVEERLALARRTLVALVADAELPPKLGVHPREPDSLTGAMPALLRGSSATGEQDLLGVKWVTGFPGNRARRIAAVHATVVLNSPITGEPLAILDGGAITAQRTAAVSGVALREWWPRELDGRASVAIVGAGVQGESHVDVLAHVAAGSTLNIADRHVDRAAALADRARATDKFAQVTSTDNIEDAVAAADVVLTMVSFGPQRQTIAPETFARARLLVAVDYDMCVPASVVAASRTFLTDDIGQLEQTRTDKVFVGYPRPDASMGEALLGTAPTHRATGPIVVNHLGVGLADVVFADAILRRATRLGVGTELPT
jgi:ornithine cyclodeaminase/alanine dehydrogenase-like protein (mu-crystallin family)